MADVQTAFAQLLARQPTDKEVQSLYRVKNAIGIRDNDALWLILMALESYDTMYRKYPEIISEHCAKILEVQRIAMAKIATVETQKSLATLATAVSKTAESIARDTAHISKAQSFAWTLIAASAFGSVCLLVGFILGSGHLPYWAIDTRSRGFASTLVYVLARTPAGYVVALVAAGASIYSILRLRTDMQIWKRPHIVFGALLLLVFSISLLAPIFF